MISQSCLAIPMLFYSFNYAVNNSSFIHYSIKKSLKALSSCVKEKRRYNIAKETAINSDLVLNSKVLG